jgi:hypothetical protein
VCLDGDSDSYEYATECGSHRREMTSLKTLRRQDCGLEFHPGSTLPHALCEYVVIVGYVLVPRFQLR